MKPPLRGTRRSALVFIGSLVICFSFAAIWIVCWISPPNQLQMSAGYCTSYPTVIGVYVEQGRMPEQPRLVLLWTPAHNTQAKYFFAHFGLLLSVRSDAAGAYYWVLIVRFWIPQLATALLMLAALQAFLRQRRLANRMRDGNCPTCGYDLRATPDRCPECGKVTEKTI